MSRIIEYSLDGAGWAVGSLNFAEQKIELDTSYIVDTFADMANAILAICEGMPTASWDYFHEPMSTRVTLNTTDGELEMMVVRYADIHFGPVPIDVIGELLAKKPVSIDRLVSDVIVAGSRMLEAHGVEGYKQSFRREFPSSEIEMLRTFRRTSKK